MDSVQHRCGENYMKLNVQKAKIISFTCNNNSVQFNYYASDVSILHTDFIRDLGVM
jgi:hypothetical protein